MSVASTLISITASVLLLAACFVTAAAETCVRNVPATRARRLRDAAERGARALDELVESPAHVGGAHALASGLAFGVSAVVCAVALNHVWAGLPNWANDVIGATVAVVVVFALGEALPRALALANPEDVGLALAPAASAACIVLYPVARVLSFPFTAATRMVTGERGSTVPWADVHEGHHADDEDAQNSEETEAMIDAFVGLERKVVREVMVPRTDMVAIEDTATLVEALEAITAAGVSRVPVYHETLDDICGVLYAKDLLPALGDPERTADLAKLARPALFVPETKPVDDLLREMRRRTHIALVADEHGGTAGLVTIEDLLEEIVGEIFDEYDPEVAMVVTLADGSMRIDARLGIGEMDELFGTVLETEADTAGGLFTDLAGHIPQPGESVEVEGLKLTVEAMEGNRVRQLIVEPVPTHEDEETHG